MPGNAAVKKLVMAGLDPPAGPKPIKRQQLQRGEGRPSIEKMSLSEE
jgi:hypothetical protein